jgi:pyruvate formate lyase activating enzyme
MAAESSIRLFQKGWSFRQDGPGNRLVWHLQGCNLRCPWCANPEGLAPAGTLLVNARHLVPAVCPEGAIQGERLDRAVCARCMGGGRRPVCLTVNRNLGVRLSASEHAVSALVAEARAALPLCHSGGGVTLSGGEPTLQFEAVKELLVALRAAGVHAALETNGTHPRLPELFPWVSTLILDLKHHDPARMKAVVGAEGATVLSNLRAAAHHAELWVRVTLVPGFNDAPADLEGFAALFLSLPRERLRVEVLGYHPFARSKWEATGQRYDPALPAEAYPPEARAAVEADLAARGLPTLRT